MVQVKSLQLKSEECLEPGGRSHIKRDWDVGRIPALHSSSGTEKQRPYSSVVSMYSQSICHLEYTFSFVLTHEH